MRANHAVQSGGEGWSPLEPGPARPGAGEGFSRALLLGIFLCGMVAVGTTWSAPKKPEAQKIIGKVVSSETGEPLGYANVVLFRLASPADTVGTAVGGALSMGDGTYRLEIPAGGYRIMVSYIGFHPTQVTEINLPEGQTVTVDLALTPDAIQIEGVEVTAKAIDNSEVAILAQQRKAAAVTDGISSQQISRTPDSNAAEVLQRVTGLSIVGGRYVYVRGLGERYSSTQVNGATVGTPEPNKRVVPLDLFAAGLLDKVVVQKSYTPDQPADFGGGVVNIRTRDFPGEKIWEFGGSTGYNALTTGKAFYGYEGGSTDFLGIDDGTRDIPDLIQKKAKDQPVRLRGVGGDRGFTPEEVTEMGQAFDHVWTPRKKTGRPGYSLSGSYGNEVAVLGRPLGFLGSLSFSNGRSSYDHEENAYEPGEGGGLQPSTEYDAHTSAASTLWGAIGNMGWRLNDFHTFSLNTMYNRSAEDEVRVYEGPNSDSGRPLRSTRFKYVERGLFTGSAGMKHFLAPLGGATLDWRYGYSKATRNEPDRREYIYEYFVQVDEESETPTQEGVWQLSRRTLSQSFTRMFGVMEEEERSLEGSLSLPFRQWGGLGAKFEVGASLRDKDRDASWRRFSFKQPSGNAIDLAQSPESLMVDENIGGGSRFFRLEESTRATDSYLASHDLHAEYAMIDLPVTQRLRLVTGARVETSDQKVRTYSLYVPDGEPIEAGLRHTDVLPSANLTYALGATMNLRAGWSATVSRPDLRELSAFELTDYVGGFNEIGNPDLKRATIQNYDLRWESYPGLNELFALSGFYKKLEDPIERTVQGGDELRYLPRNGQGGYLYGAELESRIGLGRASERWNNLAVSGNLTLVKSETELDKAGVQTSQRRPLEGQSPFVANLGLFYSSTSGKTSGSLLYSVFGRRLSGVGAFGLPDLYEAPRHAVDLMASRLVGGARIKLAIENLLNSETRFEQKGYVTHRSHRGRSVSLGLSTRS